MKVLGWITVIGAFPAGYFSQHSLAPSNTVVDNTPYPHASGASSEVQPYVRSGAGQGPALGRGEQIALGLQRLQEEEGVGGLDVAGTPGPHVFLTRDPGGVEAPARDVGLV